MEKVVRKISCNEQLYLDIQDVLNTSAIQFIFEYKGIVEKEKLENAINIVLEEVNDSNLKLIKKNWVKSDKKINIEDVNIETELLLDDDFFNRKVNYKTHSLEVYLLNHFEKKYIAFIMLHSVSDGKGALKFIDNVFKKLNDEEVIKCDNSINEQDAFKDKCKYNKKIEIMPKYKMDFEVNKIKKYSPMWKLISIDGYSVGVVAKIAHALKSYFKNDEVKFMIPVDMRRHLDNDNYLGNLTLPVFFNVSKDDSWQEVNGKLLFALKNKEELNKKSLEYFGYSKIPYGIRKLMIKFMIGYINNKKLFSMGSIISFLGRIDISKYSNDKFEVVDFMSFPLHQPGTPLEFVIVETNNKTNIVVSSYKDLINEEKLNEILAKIKNELKN